MGWCPEFRGGTLCCHCLLHGNHGCHQRGQSVHMKHQRSRSQVLLKSNFFIVCHLFTLSIHAYSTLFCEKERRRHLQIRVDDCEPFLDFPSLEEECCSYCVLLCIARKRSFAEVHVLTHVHKITCNPKSATSHSGVPELETLS